VLGHGALLANPGVHQPRQRRQHIHRRDSRRGGAGRGSARSGPP
jgi:hypothetical protein